jgi:hypothetical protein
LDNHWMDCRTFPISIYKFYYSSLLLWHKIRSNWSWVKSCIYSSTFDAISHK